MLGYGLGVCGLSFEDFGLLTPSEFQAIAAARHRYDDDREREAWERARIVGVMSVSPWSGKSVDPKRVLPLPWDQRREAQAMTAMMSARMAMMWSGLNVCIFFDGVEAWTNFLPLTG